MTSLSQLRDALRLTWLEKKDHITRAEKGDFPRPAPWFLTQNSRLSEIDEVGALLNELVDNEASFLEWRAARQQRGAA